MQTIHQFAESNRLRVRRDGCGDPIIPGKFGHIYEHSDVQMGVCLEWPVDSKLGVRAMRGKMRRIDALGLQNRQRGAGEGTWLLPLDFASTGTNSPSLAQVMKIVGIRKIRKATGRPFVKRALNAGA